MQMRQVISASVIAVQTLVSWKISQATIYVEKTIYGDYYVRTRAVSADDDCGMLVKLKAGKLFADGKITDKCGWCKKLRQIIIPHVCKTIEVTRDIALLLNVIVPVA